MRGIANGKMVPIYGPDMFQESWGLINSEIRPGMFVNKRTTYFGGNRFFRTGDTLSQARGDQGGPWNLRTSKTMPTAHHFRRRRSNKKGPTDEIEIKRYRNRGTAGTARDNSLYSS